MINQLTVFLPNEPGTLAELARVLGNANIQMHALMVADTADFGIVRIICDTPKAASAVLEREGFRAATTQVLAVEVNNVPGGLADVLEKLAKVRLNVEYAYCASIGTRTVDVLKVTGDPVGAKLVQAGIRSLKPSDVYLSDEA
ncbi:MAG: hypothetical protein Q4A01_11765 [Coriobacteriales bacterium]|nr:hypothetical protein [Coriobacteriales bacterium]